MFDPINPDIMNQFASLKLSPELLSAMGFTLSNSSLLGFISSYFYGLLMVAISMITLFIIGIILYLAAIVVFDKKELPI